MTTTIDAEDARVLLEADDTAHVAPFAHILAGIGQVRPRVVDAYRTGRGVPYHAYGRDFRHGQGHMNRPSFTHELPTAWLAATPDDLDDGSIAEARRHAADAGAGALFFTGDAAELTGHGPYELVVILEAPHDLADPAGVLSAARAALAPGHRARRRRSARRERLLPPLPVPSLSRRPVLP
jgi:hypothetical protein